MASIAEIWRYPVKSMAGERLESCMVMENGLEGDRRWAFVDGAPHRAGKLFNIKQHDGLMTYRARLTGGAVEVVTPEGTIATVDDALVRRLELESSRPLHLREMAGANFDDEPVLIVNLASVAAFADEAGMPVDHRRFRANVYLEGIAPDEEIGWVGRRIRAGEAELEVVSRCTRCVVVTKDPDTTVATPQLLDLLVDRHDKCMGVYCQVVKPGRVAVGDSVGV